MMLPAALISMIFSGTMQAQPAYNSLAHASRSHRIEASRSGPVCPVLKPGQTIKLLVSSAHAGCFSLQVAPHEAQQLIVNQPQDLEIHVRGKAFERLVDEFDMGNETVTLQTAGFYRVEVGGVEPLRGVITISAFTRSLSLPQAAAREEAERWATMSKRSKKMDAIDESLTLWRQLGDTDSIARTYLKRESALRNNNWLAARSDAEQALELCRKISDTRCTAEAANNSGLSSLEIGDAENARQRLEEAAQDWGKLHDLTNEAVTRSNLGNLLWRSGDFEHAIRELEAAKNTLHSSDTVKLANVLNLIGLYYQSLAEYEKAQGYFETAIAGFARGNSPVRWVRARVNLGRTYMLEGHLKRAQSLLDQSLSKARELCDPPTVADTLRNLGQTLWRQGNVEEARTRFEEALAIDQSNGNRRGQSSALHYLGLVTGRNGDVTGARQFFTQAAQIRREGGLRDDAAESLSALADLEYGQGRMDAARDCAEQALKLLESVRSQVPSPALRASFYSRKRQFFDLLVDMAMAPATPGSSVDGLLAAERGRARALMDLLSGGSLLALPPELEKRRSLIQRRIDYLADRLSRVPLAQQEELRGQVERFVAEGDAVEAQIRQTIADKKLGQPLTSIEEIQRNCLPADSALLEFHLGARKSYLWLVDAHQVRSFELPRSAIIEAEASPLTKWFGQILERRRSRSTQASFEQAIIRLSATLFSGLSGITLPQRLILVPDGVLHRIPFAALRLSDNSAPMGLTHDLIQVPSAAYLTVGRAPQPISQFPQTILAMVDPVFSGDDPRVPRGRRESVPSDPGLIRLPFSSEIAVIQTLVPPSHRKVLRGFDASREMLDRLPVGNFAVLHFSTHALIDDGIPELSRIVLSRVDRAGRPVNGLLLPYELSRLHLNGSIVVVSACNTALGKQVLGEGLAGFTSSLFFAGGSQLVLTLTEVDAEGSSDFFSGVYRRFLTGSTSMEHAMTLTRRTMAQSQQYSDPYYWASFIVIGRPSELANAEKNVLGTRYHRR